MQTKSCPDCGDDLALRAKRCKCGWQEKGQVLDFKPRNIRSDPAELARSHGLYRGPTEAEMIASRRYPKPANGMGTWWAKRILCLVELGVELPLHSVMSAQQVLGVKTAKELRESEQPVDDERAAIQAEPV